MKNSFLSLKERKTALEGIKKSKNKFEGFFGRGVYTQGELKEAETKFKMLMNLEEKILMNENLTIDELDSLNDFLSKRQFGLWIGF